MPTLYRQYRPQAFKELFGQEHISKTLQAAITKNKIAHAYLFHGPRGTGKTTTARILAKRLNCPKAKGAEPCGKCELCVATQAMRNIDIIEIDAASNRGIDDIRALKDGIGLSPAMGKYKVYIIDEVHMLTNEAFTALLKTLEEPVAHAVFILATTELHKVPETILSRCQVYRFHRASHDEMRDRLTFLLTQEKRQADDDALEFIIRRSDGCFRDAESLLGQLLTLHEDKVALTDLTEFLGLPPADLIDQLLASLVAGSATPALEVVDRAFAAGFDPEQILKESVLRARDGAVAAVTGQATDIPFATLPNAATRLPLIVRALIQAIQDLAFVPQPMLALHIAIVSLCSTKRTPSATPTTSAPQTAVRHSTSVAPSGSQLQQSSGVLKPRTEGHLPTGSQSWPSGTGASPAPRTDIAPGVIDVAEVSTAWPQIIAKLKEKNPVAATFLRAISPQSVEGSVLRLRANFALHRNFFDKPANQQQLSEIVSEIVGKSLTIRCFLDQPTTGSAVSWSAPAQPQQQAAEQDLLKAVKEVFGGKE